MVEAGVLSYLGLLGPSEIGYAFHPVHIHYRAGGINLLSLLGLFDSVFCLYAMCYAPCAMHSLGGAAVLAIKHRAER